jgi:hypothetical protein
LGTRTGPYAEWFLDIGTVLPETGPYCQHTGARFRGSASEFIERDIRVTEQEFRMQVTWSYAERCDVIY